MHPCKVLDFLTHNADAALVGGVEFEYTGLEHFGAVQLFRQGEDCRRFACAGGAVEEHVGELREASEDECGRESGRGEGERLWLGGFVAGLEWCGLGL